MRFLDAVRARDYGLQSASDEEIFEVAVAEDRIVFIIPLCLCGIENFYAALQQRPLPKPLVPPNRKIRSGVDS
ncbi:MAG: hypothetical protein JRJ42_10740 [Deltaproteobacteria bacterium]|nr:hypothetical protein [Deltaproteobacteria bacterium]